MKRSRAVSLVLLGAAGATAYGLAAWTGAASDQVEAEFYTGSSDCAASGRDPAFCRSTFETATDRNAADAPRFEAQADCERDFGPGGCSALGVQGPGGPSSTYHVPTMNGFAVARPRAGHGGTPMAQPLYGCPPERQRPDGVCHTTSSGSTYYTGSSWSSSGSGASSGRSAQRVPVSAFDRPASGTVVVRRGGSIGGVARGGLGATGHAVAGSHGSTS